MINAEYGRPFKRLIIFIKLADNINTFRRTFLRANVAGYTAQIIRRFVINKKREVAEVFFFFQALFGILNGKNAALVGLVFS